MLVARAKWRRLELTYDDRPVGALRQRGHRAIAELPTATMIFHSHSRTDIRAYPGFADAAPSVPAMMTATNTHVARYGWDIHTPDRYYR
ncbi:hypothetical protein [Nocardia macrotermitis]|uniref:Uncharacterized protein n=1 Tax=Nocardia macrotermitis TaxID=2585198 RepID=A0A7K0CWS6_9NOCA|nr:hypothetical protein [Nocardia macrotermitis]MQY17967.1 hypothetical protein [Nocardia macrotermitis]